MRGSVGEKNRKGSLGSPYSVKDYYNDVSLLRFELKEATSDAGTRLYTSQEEHRR